jgi:hypothetical protein
LYQHGVKLNPCLIEIAPDLKNWGEWREGTRTIRISQNLIDGYAWTTVLEVLKHEMAHQYVCDAFPIKDGHGHSFKQACARLGVATWAQTSTGVLPDEIPSWRTAELPPETQRHIDRVNKLLSLAASTNEHEAALAMQRAQEILAKHRLDRVNEQQTNGCDYWFVPLKTKRVDAATKLIFSILRGFYFVQPIGISYFDAIALENYQGYDVAGNSEDLQMAEYVYEFLQRTVANLWNDHRILTGATGKVKRSYCMGVLGGFHSKLKEAQAKRTVDPTSRALVVLDEKAVNKFLKQRYPRLSSGGGITGAKHGAAYSAGVSDGRNIVLNRPISTNSGNRGKLLN